MVPLFIQLMTPNGAIWSIDQIREMAYQSLVRPQLEYSASVWDLHVKEQIKKIEMVQRRAARWTLRMFAANI